MNTNDPGMEKITCNICETSNYELKLYQVNSGRLVKCTKCDLYYTSPRRTDIIDAVHENKTSDELLEAKNLNMSGRVYEFNNYLKVINSHKSPDGKLLDIGCYEGLFLYEARKFGWDCTGVEPHIGGAKHAREKLKLNVIQTVLNDADFEDSYFDIVTILATLEHVPDPSSTLDEIRRIINEDGLLLISVPVIPFYLNLLKKRWRMFIGDHYFFFNDQSMAALLRKKRFEIIDAYYVTKLVDINTIFARLASDDQPNNWGEIGKYIDRLVKKSRLRFIHIPINLFDTKMYLARPF